MDFDLNTEENSLLESMRAAIGDPLLPGLQTLDKAPAEAIRDSTRAWLGRLAEIGYLSVAVGKARKRERTALLLAQAELAKTAPWLLFGIECGGRLVSQLIADHGSPGQGDSLLGPLVTGQWIAASGMTEACPGPGHSLSTQAVAVKDGYQVTGVKAAVGLAPIADLFAILAQTPGGQALFLIPRETPGLGVGERIETFGYEELMLSAVHLDGVFVPDERVIGPLPGVDLLAEFRWAEDRTLIAASLGIARRCFEEARKNADQPRGDGKPPAAHQVIRFALAEMLAQIQTAEILALRAAAAEGQEDREAASLLLCAKVLATETACRVAEQAMQILTSTGFRKGNPVERAFRNARLGPILGHTSEVARQAIADDVLARFATA